ncbi:MAG TPA: GTPase HflX [Candidatus Baltobacteraceae bacterium]|jgi:GTP-binding protein HflX|nr:GTPase HflX [Candidatus Baltobacteraceae bacterium]
MKRTQDGALHSRERGIIVAVDLRDPARPLEAELDEYEALILSSGAEVIERIVQRLPSVDPATLLGSGKLHEIAERAQATEATTLFVFNDLRPRQRTNIAEVVPLAIVDRTMVILDVFAKRARSREGQLQVELAQLRYRQANLIGSSEALSRLGGGIGTRGPGETKLEVDRRRIQARISVLRGMLENVRTARTQRRSGSHAEPLVALVGYTNVGKSSLLNRLSHAGTTTRAAFVADQPFATLDPTTRRIYLAPDHFARLSDTVGFITDLPKELVAAFRATLEELAEADLFLHVIDAANPDRLRQQTSVEEILRELQLADKPTLLVANKADRCSSLDELPPEAIAVSAVTGLGIDRLREAIVERTAKPAVKR